MISDELKVEEIKNNVKNTLKWYGHIMSMSAERIPEKIPQTKSRGKRPRRRSRTSRLNEIREDIKDREQI